MPSNSKVTSNSRDSICTKFTLYNLQKLHAVTLSQGNKHINNIDKINKTD